MHVTDNSHEIRKKIAQYAYSSRDIIGKGYSSVVYKASC